MKRQTPSSQTLQLTEAEQAVRMLRIEEVKAITGLSRDGIYRGISAGKFPPQRRLIPGGRATGWLASEIVEYCKSLPAVPGRS
jgi:predicted DNA-binding transcriptional regulator AlpA